MVLLLWHVADEGVQVTVNLSAAAQVSLAVAPKLACAGQGTVLLLGQVIVGGCVSTTLTEKWHEALPSLVLTEQLTVVGPSANSLPLGGEHCTWLLRLLPWQSLAVTE
jgi:hypothetical protein